MGQSIRVRLERVRQLEHVSVEDFALLAGVSERTVWRRLAAGFFPHVLKTGKITRIHRVSGLRVFHLSVPPRPESPSSRN